MNDTEQQRIAAAVNALRPDWPTASLRTLLARPALAQRPRRDVAVALTWVACDADTKTPARVLEAGPWWRAAAHDDADQPTFTPPRSADACPLCGRHLTGCICHLPVADHDPGHQPDHGHRRPATNPSAHAATIRAQLRSR